MQLKKQWWKKVRNQACIWCSCRDEESSYYHVSRECPKVSRHGVPKKKEKEYLEQTF